MAELPAASELGLMVGVQGSGKSTWVARHLAGTHTVVSKDHWPSARRREARQQRLVEHLRAEVPVRAVRLDTPLPVCPERNRARSARARVPLPGLLGTRRRLVPPGPAEGFDRVDVVPGEG